MTIGQQRRFVQEATFDQAFRSALSRFATGVCVVTMEAAGERHGLTVNSFTSISLDPPLVAVSIGRSTKANRLLGACSFTINVLGSEQQQVAMHFAGRPRVGAVHWIDGVLAPKLAGALAHFECRPWAAYDGGDHELHVGEVLHFAHRSGDALGYYESRFLSVEEESLGIEYVL